MPEPNDEQFEKYLKSFRPVDPEPLPVRTRKHAAGAGRRSALAISAVACLAAIAFLAIVLPHKLQPADDQAPPTTSHTAQHSDMSTPALTRLALDDHAAFDEFMTEKTQSQFPPMSAEHSALRVLAQE